MIKSIAVINALLVDIKTANNSLLISLQQTGFDTSLRFGPEHEYSSKSLINSLDNLAIQFLTITANRDQFIQRTSYAERKEIESHLKHLLICIKQSRNELDVIKIKNLPILDNQPLAYKTSETEELQLPLVHSIEYIDLLKPFCRMLELVIAQERIHALSAVLETLLQKDHSRPTHHLDQEDDNDLTDEQNHALELSHYLVKQAL
ncbi:MAG: hypothetical protein OQL06_08070 [Gammaproteobacteria bacterium]|nr:hypothetical protein [Gammaproteobacteria bacterium]